jgi:CheY-like chemotaxis protein
LPWSPRIALAAASNYTPTVGAKILIVDDDPWIVRMVTTVLEKRGHRVISAADGQEAFARATQPPQPDLIITDVMMPKMDGWGLVRSLRARPEFALVPVIFLTALGGDDDRIQGFRLGADDYLPKPFRFEELDLRVGNALRKRQEILRHTPPVVPAVPRPRAATPSPQQAVGRAVAAPAPQGIHGSLSQLGLPSLLTMVEMEQKSGILLLEREGQSARLFVRKGRILAARIDRSPLRGAEAVYKLLTWSEGQFDFNAMDVDMDDEVASSTTHLLMEGARRIDEGITR